MGPGPPGGEGDADRGDRLPLIAMTRRGLAFAVAVLAAAGCGDRTPGPATIARVDTLPTGVVRVTNTGAPAWTSATAWRLEEDLRLGTATDEGPVAERFGGIGALVADSRGWIYVLEEFSQEIRVFDPAGTFLHTIGGKGEGPGELTAARTMAIGAGDTLRVADDGTMRYSTFAPDGTFVSGGTRPIRGYVGFAATSLEDGRFVDWGPAFPDGRFGARAVYWPVVFAPGAARPDSLPPLQHTWTMLPSGRLQEMSFSGDLTLAVDRAGAIWFAHTQEYRIHRRSLAGDTTLVFTFPSAPAPLGETEREYVRTRFSHLPDVLAEYLEGLPETRPIVRRILPDDAGHVFVFVDVDGAPAGSAVDVFREGGEYLGRMTLPTPLALSPGRPPTAYATEDHLYVVVHDDLDVPYVSRLRIIQGR